jgi:hypothetical protein
MKARYLLIPLCVFGASLAATIGILKFSSPVMKEESKPSPPAKARHREENAFSGIRALLRAGNQDGAREVMSALAERDPAAFLELLEKLPGMPGVEAIIRDSAARLPWNAPESWSLLNRIGPPDWRDLAWEAYASARVGQVPDEEILDASGKARVHVFMSGLQALMEDAVEKRPDEFLDLLNRKGGTSLREEFFNLLMKNHPDRAAELFSKIPSGSYGSNYDRRYVLQARARGLPTAENLELTIKDLGERGIYSTDYATNLVTGVCMNATPEEQDKVLAWISKQEPLARNRLLSGVIFPGDKIVSPQEFAKAVAVTSSPRLQEDFLTSWMESQEMNPDDRQWINDLPTERLRKRAEELLGGGR